MKRDSFILVLVLLGSLVLFSCRSEKEKPGFRIGVSQCSQDEWREKMNQEMRREMLFHNESQLEIISADDNNEKQIADIQSFIDRDFDLIIVAPNEAEALTPIIKKAYEAGIPVIIFDRRIVGDTYTCYIDLDNRGIGNAAAEYAYSLTDGRDKVTAVEITGLPGSSPAQERHQGFVEGLKKYPSIELKASVSGDWDREKAAHMADSLLNVYPDMNILYAQSDNMAIGASNVFRERGRDDIKILGTDASPGQGIEAVKDGIIEATFIYPTEGHRIIKTAFAILNGEEYDDIVYIPTLKSVDKSNAEILLRQYELINEETDKVLKLNEINYNLEQRHASLTRYLHSVVTLSIVLGVIVLLLLYLFLRNRKLHKELKKQNEKLKEESSNRIQLYHQLDEALTKGNDFYSEFITIIKNQFSDSSLSTESLAQKMSLGPAQLTRKIKALAHYTPIEILRNYRLEQAKILLLTTDKSINEITYAVGFSSAPYLTKCFREHFGQTPTELRGTQGKV